MAQPFNLGNSFLGKSTIELVNPANTAVSTTISVDSDGDLFFQRYVDDQPKGNLKFPVHSYGQSEKKNMHTDANGDVRFVNTWVTAQVANNDDEESQSQPVILSPITGVEYLVIGGGGAGGHAGDGWHGGGGGGAGGFVTSHAGDSTGGGDSAVTTPLESLSMMSIVIGQGASSPFGFDSASERGDAGENTLLGDIIAYGGGGGSTGTGYHQSLDSSGSTGGGGFGGSPGNILTPIQGFRGGSSANAGSGNYRQGAGGGGAGAAASNVSGMASQATPGGAGLASTITGSSVTYAGGGGGGTRRSVGDGPYSAGGTGGGGHGGGNFGSYGDYNTAGSRDATGYGSGGGGGMGAAGASDGGVGGSPGGKGGDGIVVLAYPDTENALGYIDRNLAYTYSAPTDESPKRSGYHVYEFVGGAGVISATEANPAFYSKELENACLFDGVSFLSREVTTASNTKTYTFSCWFKKSVVKISGDMAIFGQGNGTKDSLIVLQSGENNLWFLDRNGANAYHEAEELADPSAWYHVVYKVDTTESAQINRAKIYVNGSLRSRNDNQQPAENHSTAINDNVGGRNIAYIGRNPWGSSGYFVGYMANIQFIDGAALDANAFGTYREGVWIPKQYGTGDPADAQAEYGTNGFHLDFSDADDLGKDVSGKNNHWT